MSTQPTAAPLNHTGAPVPEALARSPSLSSLISNAVRALPSGVFFASAFFGCWDEPFSLRTGHLARCPVPHWWSRHGSTWGHSGDTKGAFT
jgi:hypothetical protein